MSVLESRRLPDAAQPRDAGIFNGATGESPACDCGSEYVETEACNPRRPRAPPWHGGPAAQPTVRGRGRKPRR